VAGFATYFTHGLWYGRESTIEEFRAVLSQFSRDPTVYLCSAINAILKCWRGGAPDVQAHARLLHDFFERDDAERLIRGSQSESEPHFVFHRQQLLFLAKEAILHCPTGGMDPLVQRPGPVGKLFLMANDHLYYGFPSTDTYECKLLNTLTDLVVVGEYSGYHAFRNAIARSHLMYSRFSDELRADPDYSNLRERFGTLIGMAFDEFQGLCFALLWKYFNVDIESYSKDPNTFFVQQSYFAQTAIPVEKVNKLVNELSDTADDFKKVFERRLKGKNDFTLFRVKPLCFVNNHLFCIDVGLLAEKLESGPFWRVHFSLSTDDEKNALHRFWGKLFERYMNWMLSECIGKSNPLNALYPNPKYQDGTEVCDAIILCGSAAVFIEYKGATFTAAAKYSGDPARLGSEVERNLIQNEYGRRKGIGQLAEAIRRTCQKKNPEEIMGPDLSGVRAIYPLLITRDGIGDAFIINELLNVRFNAIPNLSFKTVRPRRLTPLFCMAAETIEQIAPYLGDASLSDIIDGRYKGHRSMGASFFAVPNPLLKQIGDRENRVLNAAFHEFTEPLAKTLFPDEYEKENRKDSLQLAE
jgi:hypothetical protein